MTLLSVHDLDVDYGGEAAVRGLSFAVGRGETVALVGESGSGKSTAALAIMGLLAPAARRQGRILLDGTDLGALPETAMHRIRGRDIGMVFQEPMTALNPVMTIGAQIAEVLRLHSRMGRREAAAAARATLDRVGLEAIPAGRYPHQLSGGQRQRVAIAIAIAAGPRLLIADEPTTALDVTTQAHVMALLGRLVAEEKMGLLLVSHDLAVVAEAADRVVVMRRGEMVETGPAAAVLARPSQPYARMLVEKLRHVPRRVGRTGPAAAPVLEVSGVRRHYPGGFGRPPTRAIEEVSFAVRRSETVGLVGESGSGKSTLLRVVLALDRPQAGEVRINGEALTGASGPTLRRLRRQVQAVFQDPYGSFDPRHRVGRIVAEPLFLERQRPAAEEVRRRVVAALGQVGLGPEHAERFPHEFSGGQRQRIAIARALIVAPALVVLDEAVSALDVSIRADILDLLADLSARLDLAYLFVSHDLSVMRAATDRLLVLHAGRIVEEGPTADVLGAPRHPYTRALCAATPDLDRALARRAAEAG